MSDDPKLEQLRQAIIAGDVVKTREETEKALAGGMDPLSIIINGGSRATEILGQRFQDGIAFLPELILTAKAMQASIDILLPHLQSDESAGFQQGKVIMGTIVGDMHNIGKNIVQAMLSVSGFEIIDLGVDVPVKRFIEEAKKHDAKIIGSSSLLTTTMPYQRQLIQYAVETGVRDQFYFVVGGGSVTSKWAEQIGADGWSRTAAGASELCKLLVKNGEKPPLAKPVSVNK